MGAPDLSPGMTMYAAEALGDEIRAMLRGLPPPERERAWRAIAGAVVVAYGDGHAVGLVGGAALGATLATVVLLLVAAS